MLLLLFAVGGRLQISSAENWVSIETRSWFFKSKRFPCWPCFSGLQLHTVHQVLLSVACCRSKLHLDAVNLKLPQ